jgi:hypothetical protein
MFACPCDGSLNRVGVADGVAIIEDLDALADLLGIRPNVVSYAIVWNGFE